MPYEGLTAEARRAERDVRLWAREQWDKEDEHQQLLVRTGTQLEAIRQKLEDVLMGPRVEGEEERLRTGMREALRNTYELYKQIGVGAKYGVENIQRICDPVVDTEGLTEEGEGDDEGAGEREEEA